MITYKDAGVDVERGYEAVRRMKQHVAATFDENVLGGLGSFGGFYSIENENVEKPVLVAGTDGVGTKLKLAFLMDKHDTVGIDCVAMCVTISPAAVHSRCSSSTMLQSARTTRRRSHRWFPVSQRAAVRQAAR